MSIDALSQSKLSLNNKRTPTGALSFLANNGITCANAFTHGHPTQLAFPSIFTSTYPLDEGGYDHGIKNRKKSFPEIMKSVGFKTVGIATSNAANDLYGYDRGFDGFYNLFDIKQSWAAVNKIYYSYYLRHLTDNTFDFSLFCKEITPVLRNCFEYIMKFCREKEKEQKSGIFNYSYVIDKYDYGKLYDLFSMELKRLNSPDEFLANCNNLNSSIEDNFTKSEYYNNNILSWINGLILRKLHMFLKKRHLGNTIKRFAPYVSANYLTDTIIDFIDKNHQDRLFMWAHYMDIHEYNYTSKSIQFPDIFNPRALKRSFRYSLAADKAVNYVDNQIERIIKFLQNRDMLDETLIVIHGDHGIASEYPVRKAHKATLFYEEFVRVPMIFYNPCMKPAVINDLCGLIDLAPTLLDLLGIDIDPSYGFKGFPVYSEEIKKREYVYIENVGRGPCDIKRKPINIAVRTKKYKYVWRESNCYKLESWVDEDQWAKHQNELYDLEYDPMELKNLSNDKGHSEIIHWLSSIAQERCNEIRKQSYPKSND